MITKSKFAVHFVLSAVVIAGCADRLRAESLQVSADNFTRGVSKYLKFLREPQVILEPFAGPSQIGSMSKDQINAMFYDGFTQHSIAITDNARLRISGSYNHTFDDLGNPTGVTVSGILVDAFGDVLTEFTLYADLPEPIVVAVNTQTQIETTVLAKRVDNRTPRKESSVAARPTGSVLAPPPTKKVDNRQPIVREDVTRPKRPASVDEFSDDTSAIANDDDIIFRRPKRRNEKPAASTSQTDELIFRDPPKASSR
ncbi:MAG: hypothetical protein R3C05_17420 [Pirellulaceae bacterium]